MKTSVEEITVSSDARGWVFEPLSFTELQDQKNVHVVFTRPGQVRGNHYHVKGRETLVVCGPAVVRYREDGRDVDARIPEGRVVKFAFPPGVPHAIRFTGADLGVLVAFAGEVHDPSQPDTVPFFLM